MDYKRFMKKFLDRFRKRYDVDSIKIKENPQTVEEIIDHEFFYRGLGRVKMQKVEGMVFGLQMPRYTIQKSDYDSPEMRHIGAQIMKSVLNEYYEQVFIIRENSWDTILVAIDDEDNPNRFSSDLLYIADKYGWKFMEKSPAVDILFPIEPKIKNLFYLTQPQILRTYRNEIDCEKG